MMKHFILGFVLLLVFSNIDAQINITSTGQYIGDGPVYIVCATAVQTEVEAQKEVQKLNKQGYAAGYLWIPNYASLSGAKYYSVFIGPFDYQSDCEVATENYKKVNKSAYGLLVSQENTRVQINGIGKVTVKNNSQDFSQISGAYENNSGSVEISYLGNNRFSFVISVGTARGCTGDIDGTGTINSNGVGKYSDESCNSLLFNFNNKKLTVEENGCKYLHGASCSFNGMYIKP
jgi:hypothetical protein